MRFLLAILLPPLAMLLCGKVIQAIICLILMCTLVGWPVAAIWALFVVKDYKDDRRLDELLRATQR